MKEAWVMIPMSEEFLYAVEPEVMWSVVTHQATRQFERLAREAGLTIVSMLPEPEVMDDPEKIWAIYPGLDLDRVVVYEWRAVLT